MLDNKRGGGPTTDIAKTELPSELPSEAQYTRLEELMGEAIIDGDVISNTLARGLLAAMLDLLPTT